MDTLNILMEASIPEAVASAAILRLPRVASEAVKARVIQCLAEKKASKESLSRLLLRAIKASQHSVVEALLRYGGRADHFEHGENSLHIAASRANLPLVRRLCLAQLPGPVVSGAVPSAYRALRQGRQAEDVVKILSLLAESGARGDEAEETAVDALGSAADV